MKFLHCLVISLCFIQVISNKLTSSQCGDLAYTQNFDFIVVGGGAGGAVVARRLAEIKKWKILLLEAGGEAPLEYYIPLLAAVPDPGTWSVNEWGFGSQPSKFNCLSYKKGQCNYRRAKVLGGCTTNNFMMYVRGNPTDYDEWADLGNDGWSYDEVLPYFKKSENFLAYPITPEPTNLTVGSKYHSREGPLTVNIFNHDPATQLLRNGLVEAAIEIGYQRNLDNCGERQIGFGDYFTTIDIQGLRQTTAKAFLQHAPNNLIICTYSLVDKLITVGKNVVGVEVIRRNKEVLRIFAKKEVILAGGAFGTPGILERSGIGDKKLLKSLRIPVVHDLPGVGENLQDHNYMPGNLYTINLRSNAPNNVITMSLCSFGGFVNTFANSSVPDIQYVFFSFSQSLLSSAAVYADSLNWKNSLIAYLTAINFRHDIISVGPVLLRPNGRGSVHIHSKDPEDVPRIVNNYFDNDEDVKTMIRGMRLLDEMLDTEAFKYFEPKLIPIPSCSFLKLKSDAYYECSLRHTSGTLYHPSASCGMGPKSDPMAVVDDQLRVHGINGLRIADASIYPLIPRGNTQAPTIMIGEKAADIIKKHYHKRIRISSIP